MQHRSHFQAKEKSPLGGEEDRAPGEENGDGLAANGKPLLRYLTAAVHYCLFTFIKKIQKSHIMFNISFSQANLFPQGCGGRGGDGEMPEQGDHLHLLLKDARRSGSRLLGDDHRGSGVSASGLGSQHNPGGAVSWTTWGKD